MSSASLRATNQIATRQRQLERDAEPQHRAREEEGHVARVDQALEMLLRDERTDPEHGQRHRRVAAGARVGGEPEHGQRGEDEDDLRGVREVVVHPAGRACR